MGGLSRVHQRPATQGGRAAALLTRLEGRGGGMLGELRDIAPCLTPAAAAGSPEAPQHAARLLDS